MDAEEREAGTSPEGGGPESDALRADAATTGREARLAAYQRAREAGDAELLVQAALALPSTLPFGPHPGRVPALIHEAYLVAAAPADRCRLAAALARAWVYGGDSERAVTFAREAVALAEQLDDAEVTADALDAALVAHWGPDDFAARLTLAARLADAAAHLTDPAPRLSAYLWRLTTAWECLDVVAVQRQLRALDTLAEETGSARHGFFAASRRAMHALVTGDADTADRLIAQTCDLGARVAEPDLEAVRHSLVAERARMAGDLAVLRSEAEQFEAYGTAEGVPSVSAEAATMWLESGEPDRARRLLHQLAGAGLDATVRDVDFLLTVASLLEVATGLQESDITADGVRLLTPFAGRAVLNAGAVTFHGVVDDYLYRGEAALGRPGAERRRHSAASGYRRLGAGWWLERLNQPDRSDRPDRLNAPGQADRPAKVAPGPSPVPTSQPTTAAPTIVHLHPDAGSRWLAGTVGSTFELPDLKGLYYLRELLRRPGTEISSLRLSAAAPGHAGTVAPETDTGDIADAQALAAYRQRLIDIDADLDEAESWSDQGRQDRLHAEREALLDELRTATGLGGRHRRFTSAGERARSAVRKAIASALAHIADRDPALGRLLQDTIRTGASCRYDPDPARPVTWLLDLPDAPGAQRD